jgi:tRNA threonylcarbamoyladenosine biosynthesis protein TsaE
MVYELQNSDAMEQLGIALGQINAKQMLTIFLSGELGVGKTTFVRGFLKGLGYNGKVKSPTFSLVEPYFIQGWSVFHFDLYRLKDPLELENIGWRDYFNGENICLVEWPEKAGAFLPIADLTLKFAFHDAARKIDLLAHTSIGEMILKTLE